MEPRGSFKVASGWLPVGYQWASGWLEGGLASARCWLVPVRRLPGECPVLAACMHDTCHVAFTLVSLGLRYGFAMVCWVSRTLCHSSLVGTMALVM